MTREDYQEKQARRIKRMQDHADKAEARSERLHEAAHEMAQVIPFGQPILVGHHSEGRDRKYRDRIHDTFARSFEEQKKAKYWQRRVEAAESNTAISADDPDAVEKLEARIADCKAARAIWKAINIIVKSTRQGYAEDQKRADLLTLERDGTPVNLTEQQVTELLTPDFCGRIGVPSYRFQNNNANIRRMQKRVAALTALREQVDSETTFETTEGTVTRRYNTEENRVQLLFPGKPTQETRTILKHHGFRWAPRHGAWQRHLNANGTYEANRVIELIGGKSQEETP